MAMRIRLLMPLLAMVVLTSCSTTPVKAMPYEQFSSYKEVVAPKWRIALESAEVLFEKITPGDTSCYDVTVTPRGRYLIVDFAAAPGKDKGAVLGDTGACGPSVTYWMDADGKAYRTIFLR